MSYESIKRLAFHSFENIIYLQKQTIRLMQRYPFISISPLHYISII